MNAAISFSLPILLQKKILEFILEKDVVIYQSNMKSASINLSLVSWKWFEWVSQVYSDSLTNLGLQSFFKRFTADQTMQKRLESKYCLFKSISNWKTDIDGAHVININSEMKSNLRIEIEKQKEIEIEIEKEKEKQKSSTSSSSLTKKKKTTNILSSLFKKEKKQQQQIEASIDTVLSIPRYTSTMYFRLERMEFYNKFMAHGLKRLTFGYRSLGTEPFSMVPNLPETELMRIMELSKSTLQSLNINHPHIPKCIPTCLIDCTNITALSISIPRKKTETDQFFIRSIELVARGLESLSIFFPLNAQDVQFPESFMIENYQYAKDTVVKVLDNDALKSNLKILHVEFLPSLELSNVLSQYTSLKELKFNRSRLSSINQLGDMQPFLNDSKVSSINIPIDCSFGKSKVHLNNHLCELVFHLYAYPKDIFQYIFDSVLPSSISSLSIHSFNDTSVPTPNLTVFQPLSHSLQKVDFLLDYSHLVPILELVQACPLIQHIVINIGYVQSRFHSHYQHCLADLFTHGFPLLVRIFSSPLRMIRHFDLQLRTADKSSGRIEKVHGEEVPNQIFGFLKEVLSQNCNHGNNLEFIRFCITGNAPFNPRFKVPLVFEREVSPKYHITVRDEYSPRLYEFSTLFSLK
ncbi:hypothetical protein DFA_08782 [Cavenderia fasciculata]|uniref:Uncharacterized protein n=1 Tax=Cavenderia fasciculata TaxID=261658 RepID=F4Q480_CACFS|nr:uncharacterized protein DFA_08782 [Cavenderia fasciculata]EGG17782.1 hypothetical protein DFA_08782 [Cavenderia fasciculata]|eukprot:XP_004356266.1 hypothetical protein DFA_08782 [Cavenderia fasciculata]